MTQLPTLINKMKNKSRLTDLSLHFVLCLVTIHTFHFLIYGHIIDDILNRVSGSLRNLNTQRNYIEFDGYTPCYL